MAEWLLALCADLTPASAVCLGLVPVGALILVLAFADADLADFDPRPALARLIESGRMDALLVAVVNAKHDARTAAVRARHIPRDAAISLAALLALLFPVAGGTR